MNAETDGKRTGTGLGLGHHCQSSKSPIRAAEVRAAMAGPPAIIWEHEVRRLLHYRELIPRLEEALGKFSRRDSAEVLQPVRSSVPLHKHRG